MNNKNITTLVSVFFFLLFSALVSANSEEYFSSLVGLDKYNKILKKGEVTSVFKKGENLTLIPEINSKTELVKSIEELKPVIGVEILLLYRETGREFDSTSGLLAVYNQLHAVSTLEGIEYYSQSRKRMRIFFHKAYAVVAQGEKKRKDDPVAGTIIPADTLFAFLEDSTFGAYSGKVQYAFHDSYFSMDISNDSQIWYFLIPVVEPGNLKIFMAVFPYRDSILFYGFTCVNTINLFNLAESKIPSFYNRLKAMFAWFTTGMKERLE